MPKKPSNSPPSCLQFALVRFLLASFKITKVPEEKWYLLTKSFITLNLEDLIKSTLQGGCLRTNSVTLTGFMYNFRSWTLHCTPLLLITSWSEPLTNLPATETYSALVRVDRRPPHTTYYRCHRVPPRPNYRPDWVSDIWYDNLMRWFVQACQIFQFWEQNNEVYSLWNHCLESYAKWLSR